ncbi:interferon regulatory factor 8-like isoform X1 [Sinocyclocheilus anshuiensis]|uniref:Interferon regulatory factor 8-like n=1 Tax=Sinocyclocheilus anshuiensis TaxID=1608454 RepID=A0A671Q313_9TELE|nr:PREDICTED: interferon regulatory factor 8-like isoform X1 [Sinocyclocheilus anshuiensis]XP_016324031.1 PREDICTED: interferon regulatory factor 8-like isoform X1 [Sinocyclocheilus anshuiensis]XP_016324041.1 PREDICTED: interferon regulatory factor 8-like isoform X1 [Sinocyclocheilus anshuiensis]
MASGRIRSTRRLRSWIVEQVNSRKYHGLVWDNPEKTMFRIPWKHAGKQDFRTEEDAAIFKAWAEFKGKLLENGNSDPASWKTRLRCALNKSPEFSEVNERSQLDISEPYKVYRLVPLEEQGVVKVKKENGQKQVRSSRRRSSESEQDEQQIACKRIKEEVFVPQPINMSAQEIIPLTGREITLQAEVETNPLKTDKNIEDIQVNFTIEAVEKRVLHSFHITVLYIGQEVLRREVMGNDVRIAYLPPSPVPPSPPSLNGAGFHRIPLPDPPSDMSSDHSLAPRLTALNKLLPFMESGVVLTLTGGAIYAKRFCQGRVFWRGPHNTTTGPCKMERAGEPTQLFSKDIFKQELDSFRSGGKQPQSEITLCFGEELYDGDDVDDKHIIIKISIPWVESQIEEVKTLRDSIAILKSLASQSPTGEVTLNFVEVLEQ